MRDEIYGLAYRGGLMSIGATLGASLIEHNHMAYADIVVYSFAAAIASVVVMLLARKRVRACEDD